jgi:muramoyltetrapeptide carboxypeptidase LdcA involved in peptidoglycan recycling
LKPQRLQRGDTIGVVSPSWNGGPAVEHRVVRGTRHLESLGFRVRVAPHALNSIGYVSDTAENRASDLMEMFHDDAVRAIIASIGGDHSCHLLPLLDYDVICEHPKIFMGFSDNTVLNVVLWTQTRLTTFNGPTIMTEWAEYPRMPEYSERYALRALCNAEPIGEILPADEWTDEFLDWEAKEDLTRPRQCRRSEGWSWLREGRAQGALIGGCLESLQHLRGTRYWPEWAGAILFLEVSGGDTKLETVDGILMDYENMGVFEEIEGLLFARPNAYSPEEQEALCDLLLKRTRRFSFPVVANMDFGHTSPMFTIPVGCLAEIDTRSRWFAITEAGVS